jgi:hypothetical protein
MFADQVEQTCSPAISPIGRFHYSEQIALYTSCTQEGAGVAITRYIKPDERERIIVPLQISADRIYDIRETDLSSRASMVWQEYVEKGKPAPTWVFSDTARKAGAQGMFYASRSRPELTHLVLFDVSTAVIKQVNNVKAWYKSPVY